MLDELEEDLLLLDEVNRNENFTFMDNITVEENSNYTGVQVNDAELAGEKFKSNRKRFNQLQLD